MSGIVKRCIRCDFPFLSMSVGDDLCSTECEDRHRHFIARKTELPDDASPSVWLNNVADISGATDQSLIRSLITADGRGKDFKTKVLAELLTRQFLAAN